MNKTITTILSLALLAPFALGSDTKQLPAPTITGGMPLMEAINTRQSGRDYDPSRSVDDQTLSEILWVAWGMNAHGKRTIATARNQQNMDLYLITPTGSWLYQAPTHTLAKQNDKNLIPLCAQQKFVNDAPIHLLYVAKDDRWGRAHVGSAYQNVYLYATSKGLNTVIRGMIDCDTLTAELGLKDGQTVIAHQTIGYPLPDDEE